MVDWSTFKIPTPKMPSLEEHQEASALWLERIKPCLYENWPDALKRLSFITSMIKLSQEDQEEITRPLRQQQHSPHLRILMQKIDTEFSSHFSNGAFIKLSSRSAKDAYVPSFKCSNASDIMYQFSSSMRILDDLIEYKYANTPCYLLLREWHDIPSTEEWRCFIRDGKIVGISQYFFTEKHPILFEYAPENLHRIVSFLNNAVIPILSVDTVVVDIWLRGDPMVIEINPYGQSDPCLLTYPELENNTAGFRIAGPHPQPFTQLPIY